MKGKNLIFIFVLLFVFDLLVWRTIAFAKPADNLNIYFLSVGQGDSELVVLPGGIRVLIDGGPNDKVSDDLASILPQTDRYIDLVIDSHPHPDHFVGLINVLKFYKVGAFIYNGRDGGPGAWQELLKVAEENKVPVEILAANDKIRYKDSEFDILSPDKNFINKKDLNETSLVALLKSGSFKALFVGDAGAEVEKYLLSKKIDVSADVLKVGHHGSKYSSIEAFLQSVSPKIAAIEVGKNTFGHPTPETLSRLAIVGAKVFRTDKDGTIKISLAGDSSEFQVFKEK